MLEKYGIVIPGIVWGLLLLALGYFLQASFPGEYWLPIAVVVINALLKYIQVNTGQDLPDLPEGNIARNSKIRESKPKKSVRFFLG